MLSSAGLWGLFWACFWGNRMGKIRKFVGERIKALEGERDEFSFHADVLLMLSSKFKDSLLYLRLKTGAAICELKIEDQPVGIFNWEMKMKCKDCGWFRPDSSPKILYGNCDGISTSEPEDGAKELIYAFADDPYVAVIINVHESFYCKEFNKKEE